MPNFRHQEVSEVGGSAASAIATQTARSHQLGVNTKIVGKTGPEQLSYAGAFAAATLTLAGLAIHCGQNGNPWMPTVLDPGARRYQQHANYAELLTLDIDSGMTIEQAIANPFIAEHCGLAIETASSSPELNKFRLVFPLTNGVQGWQTIRICNLYLQSIVEVADKSCKDASRFYFGATGRKPFILNEAASLPKSFVEEALSWHSEQERISDEQYREALRRAEERRSQYGEPSEQERYELLNQALAVIPPRKPGSGNYDEWLRILAALINGFGEAEAIALVERFSPSIKGTSWDVARKARSFRRGTGRPATIGSVFHIARQHGFKFPKSDRKPFEIGEPPADLYQQKLQADEQCDRADEAESRERNIGFFKGFCQKLRTDKRRKKRDRVSEIAVEETPYPGGYRYFPGGLPFFEPGRKLPVFKLESMSDRNLFVYEAVDKGWKNILDRSGTGSGKSHYAGYLEPEKFGEEDQKSSIWYLTKESRNPSTKTIEENFTELPVRHQGMEATDKRTPNGRVVRKPTIDGVSGGNCHLAHAFIQAGEKGFDSNVDAASNPICRGCPFNRPLEGELGSQCANYESEGFGFRYQRHEAMKSDLLRLNPQSAPAEMPGNIGSIWEEISTQTTPQVRKTTAQEINTEWWNVENQAPEVYRKLKPIRKALSEAMAHQSRWGTIAPKIAESLDLPSVAERESILEELKPILKKSLQELMAVESQSNSELRKQVDSALRRVESLFKRIEACDENLKEVKPDSKKHLRLSIQRRELRDPFDRAVEEHKDLSEQYEAAKSSTQNQRGEQSQAARQRLENAPTQALWDILQILFFPSQGAGNFRIQSGSITLTLPNDRIHKLVKGSAFNLYLDATVNPQVLKAQLEIEDLLICELKQDNADNLKHNQVIGYGKCAKNRAESTNERLKQLHEGIRDRESAKRGVAADSLNIEIADYKSVEDFEAKIRHLSNSRVANEIAGNPKKPGSETHILIVHGLPKPNQGAIEDEYATISNPDFTFEQYYQYRVDSEIKQLAGRQRSDRYPDQQFSIYWVNEDSLPFEVEQIEAIEISYSAAPASQRVKKSIFEAICQAARIGTKFTQKLIAQIAGVGQGTVSKWFCDRGGWTYWRDLLLGKAAEDIEAYRLQLEPEEATIAEVLPLEIEAATDAEQVLEVVSEVLRSFGTDGFSRIWKAISWKYRSRFIGALLSFGLPQEVWREPSVT